jgi:hypothetical protein
MGATEIRRSIFSREESSEVPIFAGFSESGVSAGFVDIPGSLALTVLAAQRRMSIWTDANPGSGELSLQLTIVALVVPCWCGLVQRASRRSSLLPTRVRAGNRQPPPRFDNERAIIALAREHPRESIQRLHPPAFHQPFDAQG